MKILQPAKSANTVSAVVAIKTPNLQPMII